MRAALRQMLGVLAIYAIALHAILSGAPFTQASTDPFLVICHSAVPDETPVAPVPQHPCDHCMLCSATAPPPIAVTVIDALAPPRLLQVLYPVSAAADTAAALRPGSARGPPRFV